MKVFLIIFWKHLANGDQHGVPPWLQFSNSLNQKANFDLKLWKSSEIEVTGELRFEFRLTNVLKIWLEILSVFSGIENQIHTIKIEFFIQRWNALIKILRKKNDKTLWFWSLKIQIPSSEIHFFFYKWQIHMVFQISRIVMALLFLTLKAGISYFLNMYKTELKTEFQRVNFVLIEVSSIWILLEFWRCFWPQGHMRTV